MHRAAFWQLSEGCGAVILLSMSGNCLPDMATRTAKLCDHSPSGDLEAAAPSSESWVLAYRKTSISVRGASLDFLLPIMLQRCVGREGTQRGWRSLSYMTGLRWILLCGTGALLSSTIFLTADHTPAWEVLSIEKYTQRSHFFPMLLYMSDLTFFMWRFQVMPQNSLYHS